MMATLSKPKRPYLFRALYQWILDSDLTPHVLVDAEVQGVVVPTEFVEDGKIVLNLSPAAVRNLVMEDLAVSCDSRFAGRPFALYLPMASLRAIYAKETGEGMRFEAESFPDPEPDGGPDEQGGRSSGSSHLKVVK